MTTLDELFGAALMVPDAIDGERAAAARARHESSYTRYALVDRGNYEFVDDPHEPELIELMQRAAERATGRTLVPHSSRLLRLLPGSYVLAHHDGIREGNPVEVTLDLSRAPVLDAELHYRRRGQVYFRFPCLPGALAIVERGVTITCNHCYVSKLHVAASVVRLVVSLRDSDSPLHTTRNAPR